MHKQLSKPRKRGASLIWGCALTCVLGIGLLQAEDDSGGLLNKLFGPKPAGDTATPPSLPTPAAIDGEVFETYQKIQNELNSKTSEFSRKVDAAAKLVDKWGYASATGLILIEDEPTKEGRVGFEYNRSFADNFSQAGTAQGSIATSVQKSLQTSIEAAVGTDEMKESKDRTQLLKDDILREQLAAEAAAERQRIAANRELLAMQLQLRRDKLMREQERLALLNRLEAEENGLQSSVAKLKAEIAKNTVIVDDATTPEQTKKLALSILRTDQASLASQVAKLAEIKEQIIEVKAREGTAVSTLTAPQVVNSPGQGVTPENHGGGGQNGHGGGGGQSGLPPNPNYLDSVFEGNNLTLGPNPLQSDRFSERGTLVSESGALSVDDKQTIAASTTVSGHLLEMMAHPTGLPENMRAFLGVTQISVSPGWRTSEEYVCEVSVSVSYATPANPIERDYGSMEDAENFQDLYKLLKLEKYKDTYEGSLPLANMELELKKADRIYLEKKYRAGAFANDEDYLIERARLAAQEERSGRIEGARYHQYKNAPLIYSAFPLAKSQVLEQDSSFRGQTEIMWAFQAQLISAGKNAAARNLGRFIKRVEQDASTKSALPVVVPSSNGHFISYRFDPTLHAVSKPGDRESGAGQQLKALSIPALVVIVCHEEDLERFDQIRLHSHTRWVPIQQKALGIVNLPVKRQETEPTLRRIAGLDSVKRDMGMMIEKVNTQLPADYRMAMVEGNLGLYGDLYHRITSLNQKLGVTTLDVPIPDLKRTDLKVTPSRIPLSSTSNPDLHLVVSGHELEGSYIVAKGDGDGLLYYQENGVLHEVQVQAFLGGVKLDPVTTNPESNAYVFKLPAGKLGAGEYDFVMIGNGFRRESAGAVTIEAQTTGGVTPPVIPPTSQPEDQPQALVANFTTDRVDWIIPDGETEADGTFNVVYNPQTVSEKGEVLEVQALGTATYGPDYVIQNMDPERKVLKLPISYAATSEPDTTSINVTTRNTAVGKNIVLRLNAENQNLKSKPTQLTINVIPQG